MLQLGRSVRWKNPYQKEVNFSRENNFDFMQVWYKEGEIVLEKIDQPKEKVIKETGFPIIFHALLDINDFEEHIPRLVDILDYFSHNEVIIHPVCESEEIKESSINKLAKKVSAVNDVLAAKDIKLFVENNSKIDPINYTVKDLEIMFSKNPEVELLLDLAHIDDYQHLKKIVKIKKPKMLHISDKNLDNDHEHLAIGEGEIEFEYIFNEVLSDFAGKIIFEVVEEDEKIIKSKRVIENILENRNL